MRKTGIVLAVCGACAAPALAATPPRPPGSPPAEAARVFYLAYLKLTPSGIPDAKARRTLQPLLTKSLNGLLAQGEQAERRYARASKGESPPLLEGDVFSSLFEGANAFTLMGCTTMGEASECTVELSYGTTGQPDTKWMDTLLLKLEGRSWKVDDIAYGGMWDFANHGFLSDTVQFAIAESRKPVK